MKAPQQRMPSEHGDKYDELLFQDHKAYRNRGRSILLLLLVGFNDGIVGIIEQAGGFFTNKHDIIRSVAVAWINRNPTPKT